MYSCYFKYITSFFTFSFSSSLQLYAPTATTLGASLWNVEECRRGRFNVRAYTFSCKNSPILPDTHLSARPAVFLLPLPLSPSHSAAPILSRDIKWPPRHLCSLLLISRHIYICLMFRLLRITRITRAKICARSCNSVTFINIAI